MKAKIFSIISLVAVAVMLAFFVSGSPPQANSVEVSTNSASVEKTNFVSVSTETEVLKSCETTNQIDTALLTGSKEVAGKTRRDSGVSVRLADRKLENFDRMIYKSPHVGRFSGFGADSQARAKI